MRRIVLEEDDGERETEEAEAEVPSAASAP